MSDHGPAQTPQPAALTPLPRVDDLPLAPHGYDPDHVREAFEVFRRHTAQVQAQLRVLQAAGAAQLEPTGHAVRMDALHLIRAAAEFADTLERDAQNASAAQLRRAEEEIRRRQHELQHRESEFEGTRAETERQRVEIVNAARTEALELVAKAKADASRELREAEANGARLLEQSRQQATELTNAARAEVEQTLEWARAQAAAVLTRAQRGAEQLLTAAGLGDEAAAKVAEAIALAAEQATGAARRAGAAVPPRPEVPAVETNSTAAPPNAHPLGSSAPMAWAQPKP